MNTVVSVCYGDEVWFVDYDKREFVSVPIEISERYYELLNKRWTPEQKKLLGVPLEKLNDNQKKIMESFYADRREFNTLKSKLHRISFNSSTGSDIMKNMRR